MLTRPFRSILDSLSDPQQLHAALVHLPITVSALGALALLVLAITCGRCRTLWWCCEVMYAMAAIAAWMAKESGEKAIGQLDMASMTEPALQRLETHEAMGEWVWVWCAVTGALTALTAVRKLPSRARTGLLVLSVLAGLGTAGYVAVAAHHGGALVYEHGVGTPTSPNNLGRPGPAVSDP